MYNGDIIKVLLADQGKSAKELNEALGIKPSVSLRGLTEGNPSASRLEKMADFFGVPVDTFFTRTCAQATPTMGNKYVDELLALKSQLIAEREAEIVELKAQVESLKKLVDLQKDQIATML